MTLYLSFLVAFIVTALCTPFTIKLARRLKLVNDPNVKPHPAHIQFRVIARAGGLPVFIGVTTSMLAFIGIDKHVLGIILGSVILLIMGLIDDYVMIEVSPYPRLLVQFVAALIVVISGIGITFITNPFGGILRLDQVVWKINFLGTHSIVVIADFLALLWIVWMMNMINWAKGVDGQMPAIVSVAAFTIGALSLKLFSAGDPNQLTIAVLSFITAGAALGLLIFNWYPARIIPGQSASTIFGLLIAVLSILSGAKLATALLVLLVPATDFFYTFFRRILSGKSPFYGDKKHLHHLMLARGLSHPQITIFYIASGTVLGIAASSLSTKGKLFTTITVGIIIIGGILWLQFFKKGDERNI